MAFADFQQELLKRRHEHRYRMRSVVDSAAATEVVVDGKPMLSFCSNDYLGLANHPDIKQVFMQAVERWGVGSGSAHLVAGHTREHHLLEEELAEFTGRPRALLFSSGYMANQGIITGLLEKGDQLFQDKLNHASLVDAGLLAASDFHRFQHKDMASLQRQLETFTSGSKIVVSDGVFSMDGDVADLPQLAQLCQQHQALLMIDDAHGFGVLGEHGRGSVAAAGLDWQQVPLYMATLGKALGSAGAFIAADEDIIEILIQKARSYIYTTASPPAVAAATRAALKIMQADDWRRDRLQQIVQRFKQGADELGLSLLPSDTPIQPLLAGSSEQALAWSQQLKERGILITAIRPPTVPQGTARLRITFSAEHSDVQVDQLLEQLGQLPQEGSA
ncbi:MAG: 8-amino-7-oxononanoate synthase [Chromatiales bacterium]|jgi:8-amino-7-oxononanoate synthase